MLCPERILVIVNEVKMKPLNSNYRIFVSLDQRNEWIVNISLKIFLLAIPIGGLMTYMQSVIYSQIKYDEIRIDVLYRLYKFAYVSSKYFD